MYIALLAALSSAPELPLESPVISPRETIVSMDGSFYAVPRALYLQNRAIQPRAPAPASPSTPTTPKSAKPKYNIPLSVKFSGKNTNETE